MSVLFSLDNVALAFIPTPGYGEMLVVAVVALLLYGGDLPRVARSWGKTFAEFRRGLSGFQNELNDVIYSEPEQLAYYDESGRDEPGRDDTRYAEGYQDPTEFPDADTTEGQAADDEAAEDESADDNELTVKEASTDTVVIEDEKKSAQ